MAKESAFVEVAHDVAKGILLPPLSIERGAVLLYQVTVDNGLTLTVDPRQPIRGNSAFQTDLCIFERKSAEVAIPRVAIEFKTRITTHDVLTYSAKARKHKQVYPYLRYGILAEHERHVSGRVFNHNESLDFCGAVGNLPSEDLHVFFSSLFEEEVSASRSLEAIFYDKTKIRLFRNAVSISAL